MYNEHFYKKAESIRHEALDMAIRVSDLDRPHQEIVAAAEAFEKFIKGEPWLS